MMMVTHTHLHTVFLAVERLRVLYGCEDEVVLDAAFALGNGILAVETDRIEHWEDSGRAIDEAHLLLAVAAPAR